MRVHPVVLPKRRKYGLPLTVLFLTALAVPNLLQLREEKAAATLCQPAVEKQVVVAKAFIPGGKEITAEDLNVEKIPVSLAAPDVITEEARAIGRITAGPVPAGYPLADILLIDKQPIIGLSSVEEPKNKEITGPEEQPLSPVEPPKGPEIPEAAKKLAREHLVFYGPPPPAGSRVGIFLRSAKGLPIVVAEEAWIETVDGMSADVRVTSRYAGFIQEAGKFGRFSFSPLPESGPGALDGQAVKNKAELLKQLASQFAEPSKSASSGQQQTPRASVEDKRTSAAAPASAPAETLKTSPVKRRAARAGKKAITARLPWGDTPAAEGAK